jgi:hypothetical protein
MILPMKATEIRNRVVVIRRRITDVPTPRSYLNFLQQNFARTPKTDDILSVTNYVDKFIINVGSLVTKLHAMFNVLCPCLVFCHTDWWCCVVSVGKKLRSDFSAICGGKVVVKVLFRFHTERGAACRATRMHMWLPAGTT